MRPLILSCIIFAFTLGGVFLGALLRRTLPDRHLNKESQDIVRLGSGLIATIAALVLGLLIASAKGSFDTQIGQVRQLAADIILLDNLLAEYGPETLPVRRQLRDTIGAAADRLTQEHRARPASTFEFSAGGEQTYRAIEALKPQSDSQKSLQARAVQLYTDMAQTRLLLFTEANNQIPLPFLAILTFWLVILFASFSLFSSLNATVISFLTLFALSSSFAIFLVLELNQPFSGLIGVSSSPLRHILAPLGP